MQKLIDELKQKRTDLLKSSQQMINLRTKLEQTELGKTVYKAESYNQLLKEEIEALTIIIRHDAIKFFLETNNKKPVEGVSIVINKSLEYNIEDAILWAIENAPETLLKLDKAKFEKHAKLVNDTIPIEFVTISDMPSARIAKNI